MHRHRASHLGRRILPDVETVDQPAHDLDRPYLLFALPRALAADHLLQLLALRATYPAWTNWTRDRLLCACDSAQRLCGKPLQAIASTGSLFRYFVSVD